MATRKIYDLAVVIGSYTDAQGQPKNRYHNVGAVMEKDGGGKFIMIDRFFNPAGVPNPDNRSNVLLSMFEPRDNNGGGGQPRQAAPQRQPQRSAPPPPADMDDDIPF